MNRQEKRRGSAAYRWIQWGVLVLPYMVAYFHRLSIGVLREELTLEFGLSATAFAQIGAAYFYVYALLQIPSGVLADTLGPRRTVTISALITALGAALFALAPSGEMLFLGRLVIGVGVSAVFIAILKIQALYFEEGRFATMTGFTAGFGTLGAIGAQTPLYLASLRWGWRSSFLVLALISLATAVLCWTIVRDSPSRKRSSGPIDPGETHIFRELAAALSNPRTWPPAVLFAGVYGSFIALAGTWGQSYLVVVLGIPAARAANLLTLVVIGITVGGIIFAWVSDKLRLRRVPMIVTSALCLCFWIVLASGLVRGEGGLSAVLLGIGLTSGVVLTVLPCGKEVNHPDYSGTSTSVVNVGGFLGSGLIPVAMGMVLDSYTGAGAAGAAGAANAEAYRAALFVCLGALTAAVIAASLITETRCRNIYYQLQAQARR